MLAQSVELSGHAGIQELSSLPNLLNYICGQAGNVNLRA